MHKNKAKNGMNGKQRILAISAILSLIPGLAAPVAAEAKVSDSIWSLLNKFSPTAASAQEEAESKTFPVAEDRKPIKTIWVTVTAYNSVPGQTDDTPCITANGHDLCKQYAEQGFGNTIAGNGMKFGTHVRLPEVFGDKEFVVRDRMNARYEYGRIDVWLPTIEEARAFGVKRVQMEIYN